AKPRIARSSVITPESVTPAASADAGLECAPVEIRPFRCLRHAPRVVVERGLSSLLPMPGAAGGREAPESLRPLVAPASAGGSDPQEAARRLTEWLAAGILLRERRPALWIYRRARAGGETLEAPLLLALARLGGPGAVAPPEPSAAEAPEVERR